MKTNHCFKLRNILKTISATMAGLLFAMGSVNCSGQPGAIDLKSSAELPSNISAGIPATPGQFVRMSKTVVVTAPSQKVDILIVDDNSGSMSYKQKNMSNRFSSLLSKISNLDWQLGIVTTDVTKDAPLKDGRLIEMSGLPGQFVLDSKMDPMVLQNAFSQTIQRPETGSGDERGISAVRRALERSLSGGNSVNQANAQLFRSDAALAVITVSDDDEFQRRTDEQNANSGALAPDEFLTFMKNNFPNKNILWHSVIVRKDDAACLTKTGFGNEAYGLWYQELSEKTGGIVGSVCEDDYGAQLEAIGGATSTLASSIQLDCAPTDANGNGPPRIDVRIRESGQGVTNFIVKGKTLDFSGHLPIGTVDVNYFCAKP